MVALNLFGVSPFEHSSVWLTPEESFCERETPSLSFSPLELFSGEVLCSRPSVMEPEPSYFCAPEAYLADVFPSWFVYLVLHLQ